MFEEKQYFSAKLFGALFFFVAIIQALTMNFGSDEFQLLDYVRALLFVSVPMGLIYILGLKTAVQDGVLRVRLLGVFGETHDLSEIAAAEAVTYRPLRDFGGWGLRYGALGKIYNAKGNEAVRLTFTSGRILHIGSQRAEELVRALTR